MCTVWSDLGIMNDRDAHSDVGWNSIAPSSHNLFNSLIVDFFLIFGPGYGCNKSGVEHTADLWSCSYILFCMYPLCCPLPLCFHGNSGLLGSTTGNQQWLTRLSSDHHHCGKHMSISVVCWPMSVGIQFGLYPILYWSEDPQARQTSFLTFIGWVTRLSSCTEYSCQWLCLWWQFLTLVCMVLGTILTSQLNNIL